MNAANPLDSAAALWVVREHEGPLNEDERVRFEAWIAEDPRHLGAYVRLRAVQTDLQRLAAVNAGTGEVLVDDRRRIPFFRWGVAAAVILAIAAGALSLNLRNGHTYVSGVGELRQISLVDGSHMTLNTATETQVEYNKSSREITLSRGEAIFEVARDPARPFIVEAGPLRITALGTAFAVRRQGEHVDVTVTEGTVEVASVARTAGKPQRLTANQRITATDVGFVKVEPVKRDAIERELAWRQGMVAFNGESLAEAITVLNRHNRKRIVIDDAAIGARPIVGMFRADDIETFAKTAAAITDAQVVEDAVGLRLGAKPPH